MQDNNQYKESLPKALKKYFGYDQFRGEQQTIIENILNKKNCFVIMPTGAGKSLCYQLPAIISEGVTIVISPLIALMKNQVDQLNGLGVNSNFLNSSLTKSEAKKVREDALTGKLKLLYLAPEALNKEDNITFLKKLNISFVAVDEVHCVSEWGHDFRPEYRRISPLIHKLNPELNIMALTATATEMVQNDIRKNLKLDDAKVFKSSFNRSNLFYEVLPKTNAKKNLVKFIQTRSKPTGIVYCLSRKKVEETAAFLKMNSINAIPYHAGLEQGVRKKNQEDFINDKVDVVVATIAFGLGIDKPNVRFVVHFDAPKSLEGYYQETGRAGRDGRPADCLMFYSYKDVLKLEKLNKDKNQDEREKAKILLEEVSGYAESGHCRTKDLLQYFGEHLEHNCGNCDNCKNPKELFNAQYELAFVLEVMENLGATEIKTAVKEVTERSQIKKIIKGHSAHYWSSIIRQAILEEFIVKNIGTTGLIISGKGKNYILEPYKINLFIEREFPIVNDDEVDSMQDKQELNIHHDLLTELFKIRETLSSKNNIPPYAIFQEESLEEMASSLPTSLTDLTHISGIGEGKAKKFGKQIVEKIKTYVEENNLTSTAGIFVKTSVNKSKKKIKIIQGIDKQLDLEELASSLNMKFFEFLEEMEHIVHSGTVLKIDYFIENFLDDDAVDDLFEYFMEAKTDNFETAKEELQEYYSDEEIKLVHIKFISEVAN